MKSSKMRLTAVVGLLFFLITVYGIFAIDKNVYCSAWENISYNDCDLLYAKLNENTSRIVNNYYNLSLGGINVSNEFNYTQPEIKINTSLELVQIETEVTDERLLGLIKTQLDDVKEQYKDDVQEYINTRNNETIVILREENKWLRSGRNISFDLKVADLDGSKFLTMEDYNELYGRINALQTSDSELPSWALPVGIAAIAGLYLYTKQQDSKKRDSEVARITAEMNASEKPEQRGKEFVKVK